eukprot:COSAG01_NODE_37378_length_504_cov_1.066667_1_plen_79_part_00
MRTSGFAPAHVGFAKSAAATNAADTTALVGAMEMVVVCLIAVALAVVLLAVVALAVVLLAVVALAVVLLLATIATEAV